MKRIKLTRKGPGKYEARVRGGSGAILTAYVTGPSAYPGFPVDYPYRWMVETDHERFFPDLVRVRQYLNRFFEAVP